MREKLASIVVVNWNGKQLLKDCLESVWEHTRYSPFEVIVVDNGSTDSSVELIRELEEKGLAKPVFNVSNKGFSAANNQGIDLEKGGYVYLLNNDTKVTAGWLGEAVRVAESDERIGIVGSKLFHPTEKPPPESSAVKEKLAVCGAGMLIKREVIDEIGYLDADNFSPIYGEEIDFCYRARKAGWRVVEAQGSRVLHLGSITTVMQSGREAQYEKLFTNTYKAMLYNLSPLELLAHVPGYALIWLRALSRGLLGRHFRALATCYRERAAISRERQRRRKKGRIVPKYK